MFRSGGGGNCLPFISALFEQRNMSSLSVDMQTCKHSSVVCPRYGEFRQHVVMQVLQKIRGTMEVEEEFNDICEACVEANKVMTAEHVFCHLAICSACMLLWFWCLQFWGLLCGCSSPIA